MYGYIFFAIFIVAIFSIFENIKGHQKMSFFKLHLQILLFFIALGSYLFFLDEIGINVLIYVDIARVFGLISLVNIFFILANNKIPKLVIYFEIVFVVVLLIMIYNGFKYVSIKNGVINVELNFIQLFNIFIINSSLIASMYYNIFKIHKQVDKKNLYHLKIRNWSFFLLIIVISMVLWLITTFILYKYHIANLKPDTRVLNSMVYSLLLLFVLFRPRFIDEADFSYTISKFLPQQSLINAKDFDFLFYFNHYYLQLDANIDDFALKLNHSKVEVLDFLKIQTTDSFTDLLNRNRIKYFTDLLKSKKQDSFTIEALSEMSGFKNRQTMYNTFNKYHNMTPSEFINIL
jgi:AraC-like DNA-binding protein